MELIVVDKCEMVQHMFLGERDMSLLMLPKVESGKKRAGNVPQHLFNADASSM